MGDFLTADFPEVFTAQVLFLALLPCVLFAPPRWAVVAWLVMGNLDTTGGSATVESGVGWMNASKSILMPLYLWWRLRNTPGELLATLPMRLWLLLALYAALSGIWSPFPLAAAKLVGNMVGTTLTFVVLERAARRGYFNSRLLTFLIAASLCLGIIQTVVFSSYGFDGFGRPVRFSSFVTAQQYAAFLVGFLAIVLWHPSFRPLTRMALCFALVLALVVNGSRTWFLGALLILLVYAWTSHARTASFVLIVAAGLGFGALLLLNLDSSRSGLFAISSGRIGATVTALVTGEDTPERTGLANLNFRLAVYEGAFREIRTADLLQLLVGHGTSSGGNVVMRVFPRSYKPDTLDPNRVLHNEWLRSLYEWGIFGLFLVMAILIGLVAGLIKRCTAVWSRAGSRVALAFIPAFLLAFTTENLIAGAGNAVTMSLALLVSLSWAHPQSLSPFARRANALSSAN